MKLNTILLIISILFLGACNSRINNPEDESSIVKPIGEKEYFEILTWNIENFPQSGQTTINMVKNIIRDLDVDMIAVQEIGDIQSFNTLLDSLPGWQGHLSNDTYGSWYQKTGILFNSRFISVSSVQNIFTDDSYAFPRPPLMAYVVLTDLQGKKYDFTVIVVHLKANSSGDNTQNEARRYEACKKLSAFIETEIASGSDPDFIVLGDYNDQLDDSIVVEPFSYFVEKPQKYKVLTENALKPSYPSFNSLIDHIIVTSNSIDNYGEGEISVLDLDSQISSYSSVVSDHRPVMARFRGFALELE